MTTTARDAEVAALRQPFRIGVLAVVAVIVALGGVVAAFGSNADRPAGIAERWLVAVGDSTREGLEEDGFERAEEHGALPELAARAGLVAGQAIEDGERAFEDVRVGRATPAGDGERVPFRVTPYEADAVDGYLFLLDSADGWDVAGIQLAGEPAILLDAAAEAAAVVLEPGPAAARIDRPERAPLGLWLGALGIGVVVTVASVAAIRAATPRS